MIWASICHTCIRPQSPAEAATSERFPSNDRDDSLDPLEQLTAWREDLEADRDRRELFDDEAPVDSVAAVEGGGSRMRIV